EAHRCRRNRTQHLRRQQQQGGPETFSSSVEKISADFRNGSDFRPGISEKLFFNQCELRCNELINVLRGHLHTDSEFYDDFTANSLWKLDELRADSSSRSMLRNTVTKRTISATHACS